VGTKDSRVEAYIARSAPFARPILRHLRSLLHKTSPDVRETIKWGFPHFEYHGILCSMAAFKEHCTFGFWKASLMSDRHGLLTKVGKTAMGHFGRLTKPADLPSDRILTACIREAMKLNEAGAKVPSHGGPSLKKALRIPLDFKMTLGRNKRARKTFDGFSYSHKKEYVEWITDAKTEETRARRMATALAWMARGRVRNWEYLSKRK